MNPGKGFKRPDAPERAIRPKTCKACRAKFTPARQMQIVCDAACGFIYGIAQRAKERQKAARVDRASTRAALEKLKTRSDWLREAKQEVQRFRRLEELALGSPCMSCQRTQAEVEGAEGWKPGGAWDGGHFLGKGARPELALEPLNIWLQCKSCNAGSSKYARKGYTVNENFERNLVARIGQAAVDTLRADHRPRQYTIDDLKAIKAEYRAKTKELTR